MSQREGSGRKRKTKKGTVGVWRAGRLIIVRQNATPQAKTSRKAASSSMQRATAKAVKREAETGGTPAEIARRLGISEKAVTRHLAENAKLETRSLDKISRQDTRGNGDPERKTNPIKAKRPPASNRGAKSKRTFAPKSPQKLRQPKQSPDSVRVEEAKRKRLAEAERHSARLRALPIGESDLEQLAKNGELAKALEQISRHANKKDDPFAWRDLALAYRARALRQPVSHALGIVGPEKVLRKIRENPSPLWGDEVVAFLESEIATRRPKGPLRRSPLPHEKPGGVTWGD